MATKYPWKVPDDKELSKIVDSDTIEEVKISVTAELIEPMLGTVPKNEKIFTAYVAEKMGDFQGHPIKSIEEYDEEIESCPKDLEDAATGFHRDDKGIFIYNYMILGNIKSNLFICMSNGQGKVLNYKKSADLFLNIRPRKIRFERDAKLIVDPDDSMERSLRAQTPKGERTFLAKSDIVDAGSRIKFDVVLMKNDRGLTPEMVVKSLKVGKKVGLGQWRGSGKYGSFKLLSVKYS